MPPVDTTTGLNGLFTSSIALYPNPAHDEVSVNYLSNGREAVKINITDSEGKQVLKLDYGTYPTGIITQKINVSGFPKGIYFVNVSTDNRNEGTKLIVK